MGIPDTGECSDPIGVFDAVCNGAKPINSANFQGLAIEFTLTDPDFAGEEFALMASKIEPGGRRDEIKKAKRGWVRIGQALTAMGVAVDPVTQAPLEGWGSLEGLPCRLAVSTYDKGGETRGTIVWGRPKRFDPELADGFGKYRDYGCGVLPSE
jgi:hypothetical protein